MGNSYKKTIDHLRCLWRTNKVEYILLFFIIIFGTIISIFISELFGKMPSMTKITFESWLSILGNFSQFMLVLLGLSVFYQINLAKRDLKNRYRRTSCKRSIEIAEIFAKEMIPRMDTFLKNVRKKEYTLTTRDLAVYRQEEITSEEEKRLYKNDIDFLNTNPEIYTECIHILNDLEAIAINFTTGVADEKAVFDSLSQVYCRFIRNNSSFLCFLRKEQKINIFTNTIKLYKIWSDRIKKEGLLVQSGAINKQLAEFKNEEIDTMQPIGL